MFAACLIAFFSGFLSLAMEILWIRLFSFANHSLPQAFAFVLIFYLMGIAIGARLGKYFCNKNVNGWLICSCSLIFASFFDLINPWIYVSSVNYKYTLYIAAALIMLTAIAKSVVFPIAHHLGALSVTQNLGRSLSRVYVSNIMGATLGPLFVGIFLLSRFTTQQSFILCALLTFLLAMYCLWNIENKKALISRGIITCSLFIFALIFIPGNNLISKVAIKGNVRRIIENQYGIIGTYYGGSYGDFVTGGNVYDGRTNLDPVVNSNLINRVIILSALHDEPQRILLIGLSIGSWLAILTTFPGVKAIDVVEINPGYLQAIRDYPLQQEALLDPRVSVYFADARRWLKIHSEKKYDMIVMNTTYHWRAYSANLLSSQFLTLAKQHLFSDGIMAYNPTDSGDVFKTAAQIFKHAYLYEKFLIVADYDWRPMLYTAKAKQKIVALKINGKPLFPPKDTNTIDAYLHKRIFTLADVESVFNSLGRPLEIITDYNLITEYKYGAKLGE